MSCFHGAKIRFPQHDRSRCVAHRSSPQRAARPPSIRGVKETALWTTVKIAAVRRLSDDTTRHARARLPKIYSRELVDVIFEQPYCRISNLVQAGIAGRQAASRHLKALVSIGVLREQAFGKEHLFVHHEPYR